MPRIPPPVRGQCAFLSAPLPSSEHRVACRCERTPPHACSRPGSHALWSKMPTISLRRKVKTGRLRSCHRAAHWLVPSIHLTLPFPPSRQPQPWRAASSRGSGEQVGGLGRAAEAMEASAGDDRDPGDLRAHRPAAPTAAASAESGWGEGRRGPRREADGTKRPAGKQPAPRLLGCCGPAGSYGGLGRPVSPPAFTRPCLCVFPRRRRLLSRARQPQPRLQRRCAKRGRSGASRRAAERQRTQVRRPRPRGDGTLRCTRPAGGDRWGPPAAVESLRGHRPRRG